MKQDYKLNPGESIVYKVDSLKAIGYDTSIKELLVTSSNLVIIWDGKKRESSAFSEFAAMGDGIKSVLSFDFSGGHNTVDVIPLYMIKVEEENVHALIVDNGEDKPNLDIYFNDGSQISITSYVSGFTAASTNAKVKKVLAPIANAINKAINDEEIYKIKENSKLENALPGAQFLADTFLDTVGTFTQAFGLDIHKKESVSKLDKSKGVLKCKGCHAPISGTRGKVVTCPYCDTKNQL